MAARTGGEAINGYIANAFSLASSAQGLVSIHSQANHDMVDAQNPGLAVSYPLLCS